MRNGNPMFRNRAQLTRAHKLLRVLRVPVYRRALRHGVAAATEHEAIPLRKDFSTVIDVGANRGQYALFAARRFPAAVLFCFEPLALPRAQLEQVVDAARVSRVFDVALSDHNGTAEFHVSKLDDSSSLLPIGHRQLEAFPGTREQAVVQVTVRRLDQVLEPADLIRPVLLKIDVQGGELDMLRGADGLLGCIDAVIVEAAFVELYAGQPLIWEVWSFLASRGFSCRGTWSITYSRAGACLLGDFLFARTEFDPLTS
jgi:FkbM family methyltransferase